MSARGINTQIHDGLLQKMWLENPDSDIADIADAIKTRVDLTAVHIFYSRITPVLGRVLAAALSFNNTLVTFRLDGNLLDNASVLKITSALSKSPVLENLDLKNCGITSAGLPTILTSLLPITTLKQLGLSFNKCADLDGMRHIVEFLGRSVAVESLDLSHMGMSLLVEAPEHLTDEGCNLLFLSLRIEGSLNELKLIGNKKITDASVPGILRTLTSPRCPLKSLDVSDCSISPAGMKQIEAAIAKIAPK